MSPDAEMVELGAAECRELMGTDTVGRVAFVTPAGPRIVPVNFVVVGEAIEFRTTAYSELATYAPDTEVAFEVDHLDRDHHRGWSVIAHGTCERLDDPDETKHRTPEQDTKPWAGGHRTMWLRLEWSELTGRRVGGSHWPHPVVSHGAP